MRGILYGVGVGPGDPELMTVKAVRLIRENDIIALPGARPKETAAYRIAAAAVPELEQKQLIAVRMPMTRDQEELRRCHREGARALEEYLREGRNVVFLTLGDPGVYSTFAYLQRIIEADGFQAQPISGVPSFCAAAARAGIPLALWDEPIHIYPAAHCPEDELPAQGTCVLMKAGGRTGQIRAWMEESGRDGVMVENCGTRDERIYVHAEEIPDTAGYYSLIIARQDPV